MRVLETYLHCRRLFPTATWPRRDCGHYSTHLSNDRVRIHCAYYVTNVLQGAMELRFFMVFFSLSSQWQDTASDCDTSVSFRFVSCIRGVWLLDGVWVGWLYLLHLLTQLVTTSIYNKYCWFPYYESLGHVKTSESSLVVSWQRIYYNLTVTTVQQHTQSLQVSANSLPTLLNHLRLPYQETPSIIIPADLGYSFYRTRGGSNRKHRFLSIPLLWQRCVYLAVA
jgi:hypothetical protein